MQLPGRRIPWVAPALVWTTLMIIASSIPRLPRETAPFLHYDKVLHLIEYGVFAWLWWNTLRSSRRSRIRRFAAALLIVGGFLWAGMDEIYQGWRGRSCDKYDFLTDVVAIAAVTFVGQRRINRKRTE